MNGNGIVLEVKKGSVIVLAPDGSFRKIRSRGGEAVGQEVELPPVVRPSRPRWLLPAAAGALALLLAIPVLYAGRAAANPVVAYISLDVNPSFEVGVDADLKVRQLRAVNADAVPFVAALDYEGQPASLVMEELAERLAESDYLREETAEVLLAGVRLLGDGEELAELGAQARRALEEAAEHAGEDDLHVTELRSTPEVRLEAEELGLSIGQMTVYLLALEKGYDVSLDRLRTQPLPVAADWKGGLGALVPNSAELDENKLDRLLETARSARASAPASGTAKPAAEESGKSTPKPSAQTTIKPNAKPSVAASKPGSQPAAAAPVRTASPKPSEKRQRDPAVRPSATPSHGKGWRPASSAKLPESGPSGHREHGRDSERWKREAEQALRELERKKRAAEKFRSEAEQRIREAAGKRKQEQDKWRKKAEAEWKKAEERRHGGREKPTDR
ncbi:anti-sigma factor domain-containing protein [Paenibacillus albicereus]|uniref:Anti-sigma factor domain-containing protein n=1 Tax=Paenibacillus albicereus TaxID=2726185 RepID=A0A6H2GV55_9BACL|nr:anti-sigma factor domain-containing protein [Paenibacillus albicereus]QJC51311.1 anti-sigma factor domain-containing protein [Paenibacillus albicereus]